MNNKFRYKKAIGPENLIALAIIVVVFALLGSEMGGATLVRSMFAIAYDLLMNTVFYIMAVAVLAGAFAGVLTEFGVVALVHRILSPLMWPVYRLPGAAAIGIVTTFLSDNPAILTLCDDKRFRSFFKKYQLPALTNLGTSFGMGLIVIVFVLGLDARPGDPVGLAVACGVVGAVIGSIVSTRIMIRHTRKRFGTQEESVETRAETPDVSLFEYREVRQGGVGRRLMDALLEGGASGVKVGLSIIPGVLVICTLVILLTNGPDAAHPGVGVLPWIGEKLEFILVPIFGFSSPDAIAVPLTSLGSAGAAMGLLPELYSTGRIHANDLAVFIAMCMCWSGYLSTHVAMMDALDFRELSGRAITAHTVGGLAAGIAAHGLFRLLSLIV
ncbi:MAG: nucleoside recognition domain-containing protein [Saccharofermentanales bacterium]